MDEVRAPADLGPAGRRLWAGVADTWQLSPADAELLEQAARCADTLARLNALAPVTQPIIAGRFGQVQPHPLFAELRAERRTLARLLSALDFTDQDAAAAPRTGPRAVA